LLESKVYKRSSTSKMISPQDLDSGHTGHSDPGIQYKGGHVKLSETLL